MKNSTEKMQGFSKEELQTLERFVFQKVEKQTHSRVGEVLNILGVRDLALEYDLYSKTVKVAELIHLNADFKMFFDNLKNLCEIIISIEDNKKLLEEVRSEKTDIFSSVKIISEYGYKQNVNTTSLGRLKRIDEKTLKKSIDLEAEQVVLKEELAKAQKKLKEAKEEALIQARMRLCR